MPIGTNFDDFLKEEGTYESSAAAAVKKVLAWQSEEAAKVHIPTNTATGKPLGDKALRAREDSRDMAAELTQSVNEMLAGQGQPIPVSALLAVPTRQMTMSKRMGRHNRRQRKKLHLAEFQEWGFLVHARSVAELSPAARNALMDAFIEQAIEACGLLFGGGFNDDFDGFVVPDGRRASATEVHRESVRAWLAARTELTDICIGPLRDAWHE